MEYLGSLGQGNARLDEEEVLKCAKCLKTIIGPKIVMNEQGVLGAERYWCKECVYYKEMKLPNPDAPEYRP